MSRDHSTIYRMGSSPIGVDWVSKVLRVVVTNICLVYALSPEMPGGWLESDSPQPICIESILANLDLVKLKQNLMVQTIKLFVIFYVL